MIYLILNILSAVIVALLFKISELKKGNKFLVLFVNYVIAFSTSFFLWYEGGFIKPETITTSLGLINGVLFILTFLLFMWSISLNGVGISTSIMRLAVIMPIVLSIIIFLEIPSLKRGIGIVLAITALYFFGLAIKENERNKNSFGGKFHLKGVLIAIFLFLSMGSGEFVLKLFDEYSKQSQKEIFFVIIFGVSLLISLFLINRDKERSLRDIYIGFFIGVFNYLNLYFFVLALSKLPAVVVFAATDVSVVSLTVLAGKFFFKEKIPLKGYVGLSFAILSLFLIR